jgi:hypothetical protein
MLHATYIVSRDKKLAFCGLHRLTRVWLRDPVAHDWNGDSGAIDLAIRTLWALRSGGDRLPALGALCPRLEIASRLI